MTLSDEIQAYKEEFLKLPHDQLIGIAAEMAARLEAAGMLHDADAQTTSSIYKSHNIAGYSGEKI